MTTTKVLFTNGTVWTGAPGSASSGEVLVDGNMIVSVGSRMTDDQKRGAVLVDLRGATLMPGLIDGHSHLSFLETPSIVELGFIPVEEHLLATMANARRVLLAGFTSCIGASSAKPRLDIAIRNAINAGKIPGPRLLASTPEITVTGGLGDERKLHMYLESEAVVLDGTEEIRRYVRTMAREGVDIVKLNVSGSLSLPNAPAEATVMCEDEIAMATSTAHQFGKRVASHAHSAEAVKLSIKHGVEIIHHCTLADDEAIDLIAEHREKIFVGPAVGQLHNSVYEAAQWGITREIAETSGLRRQLESCASVYQRLRKLGARVLIGGDYGFAWSPHGTQARDLTHFVNYFGYTHEEALVCATVVGAAAMRMESRIGQIKQGFLADMIVVRGRPYEDVTCLSQENILAVMKDGVFHGPLEARHQLATAGDRLVL